LHEFPPTLGSTPLLLKLSCDILEGFLIAASENDARSKADELASDFLANA